MDYKLTTKDAVTILRNLQDWLYYSSMNGGTSIQREAIDIAIGALKQPEIIRCKDCKYWREHKYAKETKRYIPFCGFNAIYTKADDFCSYAERK